MTASNYLLCSLLTTFSFIFNMTNKTYNLKDKRNHKANKKSDEKTFSCGMVCYEVYRYDGHVKHKHTDC